MYQFGPYGPNHATAGTFAFKRKLLENHKYNDTAALAEEKEFLNNYTVPFVQLEPKKTILVFSHRHNTFDKKKLLEQPDSNVQRPSDKTVDDFIKDPEFKDFYMNKIEVLLVDYKPGEPEMKPDVLKQIKEIDIERKRRTEELTKANAGQISINKDGQNIPLNNEQIVSILQQQQNKLHEFSELVKQKDMEIENLKKRLEGVNSQQETYSENLKRVLTILIERDTEIKNLKSKDEKITGNIDGNTNQESAQIVDVTTVTS